MNLVRRLADAVDRGQAIAVATVVDTARSVPRHAGAKMLVHRDGSIEGTVGGGEMEARVVAEAVSALADGRCRLLSYRLVDPARGDAGVCGGDVQIFVEPHMPEPTIAVLGYGHVGRAVCQLARWLGFRVVAVDDRAADLQAGGLGAVGGRVAGPESHDTQAAGGFLVGSVSELLSAHTMDQDVSVVLVTRSTDVDSAALPVLLGTDVGYVGVMGSERRWATTRSRLEAEGVDPAALDRVHAPIGIEVNAETPEEIALSIMAEVVAHRRSVSSISATCDGVERHG